MLPNNIRILTFGNLSKILRLYHTDPLTWNPSILCKIFNIPEDYCRNLVAYVQPFLHYANREVGLKKFIEKTSFVVDVQRLKVDKKYLSSVQRIVFPKNNQIKLNPRAQEII